MGSSDRDFYTTAQRSGSLLYDHLSCRERSLASSLQFSSVAVFGEPCLMAVKPLDTLLAIKVLSYAPGLTANARAVGALLIDRYNRKTGQCDPGLESIASHVGINVRTVMRSVRQLETAGLLRKLRHGGNSNRNQYEPNWQRFRDLESAWRSRLRKRRLSARPELSPSTGQDCHLQGDKAVTQTYPINLQTMKLYSGSQPKEEVVGGRLPTRRTIALTPRSRNVSEAEAERRWTVALHECFGSMAMTYADIIDVITPEIQAEATTAELKQRGGGIAFILRRLKLGPDPRRNQEH